MNRILTLGLLVVGVVLIVYGINASNSVGSSLSRLFTGAPTDHTVWLLIAGIVAAASGAGGLMSPSSSN